jgi:hypothetical protein
VNKVLAVLVVAALTAGISTGAAESEIELLDGSMLSGEVLSFRDGAYTVRTDALGTLSIEASRIRAIRQRGSSSPPAGDRDQVRAMQQQLLSDPATLSQILSLKDDPALRQALEDPEIMKAVEAGDLAALAAHPKILRLLNNPVVQDIRQNSGK